jgi:SAM-dependent methyltransferase
MDSSFGAEYAGAYDVLYRDKDYAGECGLIENVFRAFSEGPVRNVLDLGCGTGNHAIALAERGYTVVGVDRSEGMLAQARWKARRLEGSPISFHAADIRSIDLKAQFDAALLMFAVLGYQLENADVSSALKAVRRHLRPGGLVIFDVWYGPAVLSQHPSDRMKTIPTEGGRVIRFTKAQLDPRHHRCDVHFRTLRFVGDRLVAETDEEHPVRYFFPKELELFLASTGFSPLRLGGFPNFQQEPDETTWNVLQVARAI